MKRSAFVVATLVAAPMLGAFAAAPAFAGETFIPPVLTITNTPTVYTVNQAGNTITFTLTQSADTEDLNETYVVTGNIPTSFTITGHDDGDFNSCEIEGQVVTCSDSAALDESQKISFSITVTPTQIGTFPATGDFTNQQIVPTAKHLLKGRSANRAQHPAAAVNPNPTVTDNIKVIGPTASATPTPTVSSAPTKTAAPTKSPTHKPTTHKPTHKATHKATVKATTTTQTLPNTGSSDLGPLAAAGAMMIAVGAWLSIVVRRRRPSAGRHL